MTDELHVAIPQSPYVMLVPKLIICLNLRCTCGFSVANAGIAMEKTRTKASKKEAKRFIRFPF